jgi:outer membrane phospholipase A
MASIVADGARGWHGLVLASLVATAAAQEPTPAPKPARPDAMETFTINETQEGLEPPLTENEPVYFIIGTRGDTTARFQLSFKYRLFDRTLGWGKAAPWLSGFYVAYTQTSIWNLSDDSKPFQDTSYRPSLFWLWEPGQRKAWVDALRLGFEHESNGQSGPDSRSVNTFFVRPEWRWHLDNGKRFEFTPKIYDYLDRDENPDIPDYRGYVDWQFRYGDDVRSWRAMARYGTAGKGSLTLDWFERTRTLGFGVLSGYFHVQFFTGYGEDILDYNQKNKSQIRFGFAIVP